MINKTALRHQLQPEERLAILLTGLCLFSLSAGFIGSLTGLLDTGSARFLYIIAYLTGGYSGVRESTRALMKGEFNVDTLMILAAVGAALIGNWLEGAVLLFLFSLSSTLEHYAMERNRREIESIMKLRPDSALLHYPDGTDEIVAVKWLKPGDMIIVKPGERIPIDGIVINGASDVNQAAITGESQPVFKERGDEVFAATLNEDGVLTIQVTRHSDETTLAKIISMVEQARSEKAATQRILDNFESPYAIGVVLFTTALILIPYYLLGEPFEPVFYRAMTVLVVASPCALIISTPASILSAIANAAKQGVLFKGGVHLEQAAEISAIAFDKTGTLTTGKSEVTDLLLTDDGKDLLKSDDEADIDGQGEVNGSDTETVGDSSARSENDQPEEDSGYFQNALVALVASVEEHSEHHLASALLKEAKRRHLKLTTATDVHNVAGKGITAKVYGVQVSVGNRKLLGKVTLSAGLEFDQSVEELESQGKTLVFVGVEGRLVGAVAFADHVRNDAPRALIELRKAGIKDIVILSGDSNQVASRVAGELGIDQVYAELLPEEKVQKITEISARQTVAMVGDGVNDAPALAASHLGIAMGAVGTDVALETADVVLMSDDLSKISYAINLARKAKRIVWQNIYFSLAVIVVLILSVFFFDLPLPLGVVGHEGSTLIVVLNGLRLLNYR